MKKPHKRNCKHVNLAIKALHEIEAKNKPFNPETIMTDGMVECENGSERFVISGSEAVAAFWRLTSNIQWQPDWNGKFSEKYISKELRKILAGMSSGTFASLAPHLEEFIQSLQEFKEIRELVIPIQGLKLDVEVFHLGGVTFRPADQQQLDQLLERAEKVIQTLKCSKEDKEFWRQHYQEVISARLGAYDTLAFSETVAEVDQARVNASRDIDLALNVLRFLTPYTQDLPEYVGLGLPGQFAKASYSSIVFSEDGSFNTDFPLTGRHLPFRVDLRFLDYHEVFLRNLSEIILAPTRSELEGRILSAIEWAGRAQLDSQPRQQLLSLMTALECLLNSTNGKPFRFGMSESAVLLIGADNLDERVKVFEFLCLMYDKRSAVTHGSSVELAATEIVNLQGIAGAVIFAIVDLRKRFTTRKDLENFLARARLEVRLDPKIFNS